MTDNQRKILREKNITFACFKMVVSALLTKGASKIDEDSWNDFYSDFVEGVDKYEMSIEEFTEVQFQDFTIDNHEYELRSKCWKKQREQDKPPFNIAVLLETEGDEEFILGMWDISEKWTELPSYEDPLYPVIGWYYLPQKEETKST